MTRLGGEVNMMIIDTADHVEDQNVKPVKPNDAMKQTEKQNEKQSETAKQTEEPMLDEAWARLTTSFDVLADKRTGDRRGEALSPYGGFTRTICGGRKTTAEATCTWWSGRAKRSARSGRW